MSPLNITQPSGIWSIMAIIRWCPIYPKWDSYQPLLQVFRLVYIESSSLKSREEGCVRESLIISWYMQNCWWEVNCPKSLQRTHQTSDCGLCRTDEFDCPSMSQYAEPICDYSNHVLLETRDGWFTHRECTVAVQILFCHWQKNELT